MIRQPKRGTRNVNDCFYDFEAEQIDRLNRLNEIFGNIELSRSEERTLVWLAGWEESTVKNVISAIRKVMAAETIRLEQPSRPEAPQR
ncbi:MAG: hypothetical protein LUE24_13230 [Lachnospiraceae bacterium]|nr:hypothetical protein [Lachnospiraceae bacterium]